VSSFRHRGHFCLLLVLVMTCAVVGCRRAARPAASTTAAPSTTTVDPVEVAKIDDLPAETPVVGDVIEKPEVPEAPEVPEQPAVVVEPQTPEQPAAPVEPPVETPAPDQVAVAPAVGMGNLVPIDIELPAPAFRGTPKPQNEPNVQPPLGKPRPPFFAPEGTLNLASGKPVRCSDPMPSSGEVDLVTDGDKEASDFGYLGLRSGTEWVQVDLGQKAAIYAVLIWHNHAEARVYRDVIVQVSDDPDFLDPQTVFNNDYDNSSGMGIGPDMGYIETSEGKLIDCKGVEGRFVRFYSRNNHIDDKNHYTEVEVYGKPAT